MNKLWEISLIIFVLVFLIQISLVSATPVITIYDPIEVIDYGYVGKLEILNVTINDSSLAKAWYNYNGTNITIPVVGTMKTYYNNTYDGYLQIDGSAWECMTFNVTNSYKLTRIGVRLEKTGAPINYLHSWILATNSSNYPAGAPISSGRILASSITTPRAWYNITVGTVTLNANSNYSICLAGETSGWDGSNWVGWSRNTAEEDYDGQRMRSLNNGTSFTEQAGGFDAFLMVFGFLDILSFSTTFNLTSSPFNITVYANDTSNNLNLSFIEWNYKIFNNSETYNNQSYETSSETFLINVTANSSLTAVDLIYDGTEYTGTNLGSGIWSKTIDIPLGSSNKNFYWNFTYAEEEISSSTNTQTVNLTNLSICGGEGGSTIFLNFSFKDEATGVVINASNDLADFDYWLGSGTVTKNYIFTNTTDNFLYQFCALPNKTFTIDLDFKYSKTGYPQRTHTYDNKELTNSTTTKILYLLSSTDGIYSTIQFLDAGTNSPISGVEVTAEREILGTWTLINQGITDAAGAITFWVNPDYEHRITATKTGYASVSETITPTQTTYTIFMGTSATVSIPGYRYKNIRYVTYPAAGRLEPNTIYTFGFNVTAGEGNIISCKIDIKNLSLSTVATSSIGCGAYGGNVSVSYNVGDNSKLFGYYYVDIGDGLELFKANDAWYVEFLNTTSTGGLISFFESLGDLDEWGDTHNRQEFSKITFFFFIMILTIGIFTFFSGYELSSPGAVLILVWAFVAFGAVSGVIGIEGLTPYDWWNKYVYFIITSFLLFGFILNKIRRDNL